MSSANPEQLDADAVLIALGRGGEGGRIVGGRVEVGGEDALQREVAREQRGVCFEAGGALPHQAVEDFAGRQQLVTERALGLAADDPLRESERREKRGEHQCGEGKKDPGAQTALAPTTSWIGPHTVPGGAIAPIGERKLEVRGEILAGHLHLPRQVVGLLLALLVPRGDRVSPGAQAGSA